MDNERLLFFVLAFVLVLAIVKGPAMWQARKARGRQLGQLAGVLPGNLDPQGRFLIYFWSPSCGMCRGTTPVINELMTERGDVLSLNVLDYMDLAREAGVMGTPAFLLVNHGMVEELVLGARSKRQIVAMLDK